MWNSGFINGIRSQQARAKTADDRSNDAWADARMKGNAKAQSNDPKPRNNHAGYAKNERKYLSSPSSSMSPLLQASSPKLAKGSRPPV